MFRYLALLAFLMTAVPAVAATALTDSKDCYYPDWDRSVCLPNITRFRALEVSPFKVDFSEGLAKVEFNGQLDMELDFKIDGRERQARVYTGPFTTIDDVKIQELRSQLARISREAEGRLERFKQERRSVKIYLGGLAITGADVEDEKILRQEASDFFNTFMAGTTELGQAHQTLFRNHFNTLGRRLTDAEKTKLTNQLTKATEDYRAKGIDLDVIVNCMDDQSVCEELFVEKFVADNRGRPKLASFIENLVRLKGADLIKGGSTLVVAPSTAVSEEAGVDQGERNSKEATKKP